MRYGLRTLFAALTVMCGALGYLGYEFNWVRERQSFMEDNQRIFFELAKRTRPPQREYRVLTVVGAPHVATIYVTVPTIQIQPDGSEVQVRDATQMVPRIRRLFPEAEVIAFPYRIGPAHPRIADE